MVHHFRTRRLYRPGTARMENKSVEDICELLKERGFPDAVMSSFKGKMISISARIEGFTTSGLANFMSWCIFNRE